MNYLLCPHFHFSGTFLADAPTGNSKYSNFNPEKFDQSDMSWNPKGRGEWSVSATVTGICYTNGDWVEQGGEDNANDDPILGAPVLGKKGPRNLLYVWIVRFTLIHSVTLNKIHHHAWRKNVSHIR